MKSSLHQIFQKYVNDDCTEEEIRELIAHFQVSTEEDAIKEFINSELNDENAARYEPADTDVRLNAVYKNIEKTISRHHTPIIRFYRSWPFRAAAAILLIIAAGVFWMVRTQHAPVIETAKQQVILPGKDQAVLITGDGHHIALGAIKDEVIPLANGGTIKKTANGQIAYLAADNTERGEMNTIKTPAGGQWKVTLPDQTQVWLNASSSISYQVPFNRQERKVILSGEAYFDVSRHPDQPFTVVCPGQQLQVLGTSFNVMAYPEEHHVRTTLVSGAVSITGNNKTVKLVPGEQAVTDEQGIQVFQGVDQEEATSWKDGYFKFNGNLENIMNRIARWYDVEIIYENKPLSTEIFEGEISRTRELEEVLHIIEFTGKVHFTLKGRTIIVRR